LASRINVPIWSLHPWLIAFCEWLWILERAVFVNELERGTAAESVDLGRRPHRLLATAGISCLAERQVFIADDAECSMMTMQAKFQNLNVGRDDPIR